MPLFQLKKVKVKRIKSLGTIKPESKIHELVEKNLSIFFPNLTLIQHKPKYGTREIDTLAFDSETNAPVIIEFKVSRSRSVSDQVESYLTIMMQNKQLIRYQIKEKLPKIKKIDFNQTRIMIIANDYSEVQINALARRQHYVEMWRYTHYDGFLLLESVKPPKVTGISIPGGKKVKLTADVPKYENVDHFRLTKKAGELYEKLHEDIMGLDATVRHKIRKNCVGYWSVGSSFSWLFPRKKHLTILAKLSKSPKSRLLKFNIRKDGWVRFRISDDEQIPGALNVIEKAMKESQ
jgi:predicted transport protein